MNVYDIHLVPADPLMTCVGIKKIKKEQKKKEQKESKKKIKKERNQPCN